KMATGEESDDESLGGAQMHAKTSGLADYLAVDERDAIRLGRQIMRRINWRKAGPTPKASYSEPLLPAEDLLGIVPTDLKVPFDPREVIARLVDGSEFDEFKPLYGQSLVTGFAQLHGHPIGILANAQGVLFSQEAQKAAQFIQLANQRSEERRGGGAGGRGRAGEEDGVHKTHGAENFRALANTQPG